TPSDCFETFPFPVAFETLESLGEKYASDRADLAKWLDAGLTAIYNAMHDPENADPRINRVRELQIEMDHAVAEVYGWKDICLDHSFRGTPQGTRSTISPAARQEILDRLLELNHQRYREEVEQGLHDEANGSRKTSGRKRDKAAATSSPLLEGV